MTILLRDCLWFRCPPPPGCFFRFICALPNLHLKQETLIMFIEFNDLIAALAVALFVCRQELPGGLSYSLFTTVLHARHYTLWTCFL